MMDVLGFIKKENLFNKTDNLVIALSGGSDSFCLTHLLQNAGYKIILAHVNHHKRFQSEIEEAYIIDYAKKYNIPLEIFEYFDDGKDNFQGAAHHARYEFFYNVCQKYNAKYILTAHHAKDNLETILLNIISGSNLYGYAGIHTKVPYKDIFIVRPLITTTKEEINEYIETNNIKYFEDESNHEDHYLRNRIRHNIILELEKENPNLYENIQKYSQILNDSFELIRNKSLNFLKETNDFVNISDFLSQDNSVQKDIICLMLERINTKPSFNLINEIITVLKNNKPNQKLSLQNGFYLIKEYDQFYIKKDQILEINNILNYNESLVIDNYGKFSFKDKPNNFTNCLVLCYNDTSWPLIIRTRQEGDKIKLSQGTKKIKDLFIDLKVPMEKRNETLLVTDSQNNVLWVVGYKKSASIDLKKGDTYLVFDYVKK